MEELNLKDLLTIVIRKKISIIVIVVISIIIGCIYSFNYTVPRYKSRATVILGKVSSAVEGEVWNKDITISESDLSLNSSLILTYSELVRSRSIMEEVSKRLNYLVNVDELMENVAVSRVGTSDLLEVTAVNVEPMLSKNIVTEVVDVFAEHVKEIYKIENVYIIDKPTIDYRPYNINHIRDIAISACVGMFLSFVYVYLYVFIDNTIKSSSDIEEALNVKTLINIPINKNQKDELITVSDSKSIISEAFKTLRTNIQFSNVNMKGPQTLLITSCLPSEGKSYVSANLAVAFAQAGKKVILVDSDMRRGRQSKIFNIANINGLSNYISNIDANGMEINWNLGEYIRRTDVKNLNIITSGNVPPNPAELLGSNRLIELVESLKNYYDIIIFDGAPILPIADSLLLGRILGKVMLVAVKDQTKRENLITAKANIEDVGGKVIGVVLNKVSLGGKEYGNKYYYYYSEEKKKPQKGKYRKILENRKKRIKNYFENAAKKIKTHNKRLGTASNPVSKPSSKPAPKPIQKETKVASVKAKPVPTPIVKTVTKVPAKTAVSSEKNVAVKPVVTKTPTAKIVVKAEEPPLVKKKAVVVKEEPKVVKAQPVVVKEQVKATKAQPVPKKQVDANAEVKAHIEALQKAKQAAIQAEENLKKQRQQFAKEREIERLKREKEKMRLAAERATFAKIQAEERVKEELAMAEEKIRMQKQQALLKEKNEAMKREMKIKREKEKLQRKKDRLKEKTKRKAEWDRKYDLFKAKTLSKKDEFTEEFQIKKEEYSKRYNEYKNIKAEEIKTRAEVKAKKNAEIARIKEMRNEEIARIREEERLRREKERRIAAQEREKERKRVEAGLAQAREEERLKKEAEKIKIAEEKAKKEEEKLKKEQEIAIAREQERKRKEEEKRLQQAERAKQIAILAEEKAKKEEEKLRKEQEIAKAKEEERLRKEAEKIKLAEEKARLEEEAKYTDEYLQENLYPKTKYSKF